MKPRDVAGFLAELERRLRGNAGHRRQVVSEIADHLADLVSEARAQGCDQETAEGRAVERFGSPRRLARSLGRPRRVPRAARIALALGALGLTGGFAYAQLRAAAPVVAVSLATDARSAGSPNPVTVLGQSHLVSLDPVSLRVLRRGAPLFTGRARGFDWLPPELAIVAPDGSKVAVVADAALNFYDLQDLKLLGTARLGTFPDTGPKRPGQVAGEADVIRAGAWLGGNVVALIQHQAPPYARHVTSRTLVVVDPSTRRIVSRHTVALKGKVVGSVRGSDRVAILACGASGAAILSVEADGSSAVIRLRLPCPPVSVVGFALSGSTLALVEPRGLTLIDLERHIIRRTPLLGERAWKGMPGRPMLRAVWWHDRLIVTGSSYAPNPVVVGKRAPPSRGAGVTSIDPSTGRTTIIARQGSWVLPTPDRLIVGGLNLGLTAFAPDGKRVWHVARHQTVYPYAIGDTVFAPHQVKRHTIVDAYAIDTGRLRASVFQRGVGTRPFSGALQPTG